MLTVNLFCELAMNVDRSTSNLDGDRVLEEKLRVVSADGRCLTAAVRHCKALPMYMRAAGLSRNVSTGAGDDTRGQERGVRQLKKERGRGSEAGGTNK